ncbi:LacI family DNA-binding transcriptional regulator [Actinoplanes sp. NBRC 101535]|uniref:LacI family DNA-binding transcriptional regulator n=1 Tax=Actinoplanes sp. NBRC 101535 TaxID=3032196 RepID=UPI0024A0CC93|nr:LacI family DNA-binding transcriptional regulator [Actinoplanes sp. NBRC 101535]GLY04528.1 LacI family transcriptional regulator [Actinoplanes sp. NBRC 101535]
MAGRVTIRDVARAAGVSYASVSRFLNRTGPLSPATRRAVESAVAATGFVPHHHARRLAGARPDTVAFLHCVGSDRLLADPNVNDLMAGCATALADRDILMVTPVGSVPAPVVGASALVPGVPAPVFGVLSDPALVFSAPAASAVVHDLIGRDLPVVACGTPLGYEQSISYVTTDDRAGAREIVTYLRSRGRRRIATVTGPLDLPGGVQRLAGYRDAVDGFDPALVAVGDFTFAGGKAATEFLLRRDPTFDALFAASDMMAAGALEALREAGRSVPGDVAVAGFDDAPVAMTTVPPLTTMRIPWSRYPGELVRQLLRTLDGDLPSGVVLPLSLTVRAST